MQRSSENAFWFSDDLFFQTALKEVIRQQQTEYQAERHAQEAGDHKAVVENEFADFG